MNAYMLFMKEVKEQEMYQSQLRGLPRHMQTKIIQEWFRTLSHYKKQELEREAASMRTKRLAAGPKKPDTKYLEL